MKRIMPITLLLAVLLVASCNWFENPVPQPKGEFRLTLMTTGLGTKGPEFEAAGETNLNENLIDTVDIFFYEHDADDNTNAVHCLQMVLPPGSNSIATITIPFTNVEIDKVFGTAPAVPAPATARIYVIANAKNPARTALNTIMANAAAPTPSYIGTSINSLKNLEVMTNNPLTSQMAQSFVMDGYDVVTLTADRTTMSGHVKMDRSACKIRVFVTQIDPVTIGEGAEAVTWTPRTDQMRLFFFNGVKKSHIDETVHPYTPVAGDYYTIRGGASTLPRQFTREPVTGTLDYWFNTVPYYTYPYEFDPDTMDRTYLTLVLPWYPGDDQHNPLNTYYQIPINVPGDYQFTRNEYYQINITLSMLGSFEEEEPLVVPISVIIADWSTAEIKAELRKYQYFTEDRIFAVLNNESSTTFSYSSSSPVKVKIDSVTYMNYSQNDITVTKLTSTAPASYTSYSISEQRLVHPPGSPSHTVTDTYTVSIEDGNIIRFEREIPNGSFSVSTITFTVSNDDGFSETIVIKQYSPIYITGERSYTNVTSNYGSVIVYGYCSRGTGGSRSISDDQNGSLGAVVNFNDVDGIAPNTNQNQYTMYVGVLCPGLLVERNYSIGDPRVPPNEAGSLPGLQNYGPTVKLDQYRRTRTDIADVIAPAYKIASSYGKTTNVTFAQAEKRCAAYQENGYPAGRWRVPTEAEIMFIVNRSKAQVIPQLFGETNDAPYWASSKRHYSARSNVWYPATGPASDNTLAYVRCVYDVWYWGDKKGDYNKDGTVDYGVPMMGDNPLGDIYVEQWGNVR